MANKIGRQAKGNRWDGNEATVSAGESQKYLGTFTLQASQNASGAFSVSLREAGTRFRDSERQLLDAEYPSPLVVTVNDD